MSEADLCVKPRQVMRRIAPVQTDGGPTGRLGIERGKRLAMAGGLPSHVEHGVARRRLIARVLQKGEELLARDVVLAQREGLDRHEVLRPFIFEPPALARRTAHDETPGRKSDHDGAFGTFLELAILSLLGNARADWASSSAARKDNGRESLGQSNHAHPDLSGRIIEWLLRSPQCVNPASDRCFRARPAPWSPCLPRRAPSPVRAPSTNSASPRAA